MKSLNQCNQKITDFFKYITKTTSTKFKVCCVDFAIRTVGIYQVLSLAVKTNILSMTRRFNSDIVDVMLDLKRH